MINKKTTYVRYYGLEKSLEIALDMINKAKEVISIYGDKAKLLADLADFIVSRDS